MMARALELAERFAGRTAPNPIVGCVIVDARGKVIAEAAHERAGSPHAERLALDQLDAGRAKGGTLYVTLEPCTHHGRTPPCAPAVIASGVARVVVGSADPIAAHAGGIEAVRAAGIEVDRALVAECDAANQPFFTLAKLGRPQFTLKAAITLDGKIATVGGESKWITGEVARGDGHALRDRADAVMVGIGTVIADNPRLTARVPNGRDPIRVVVDSALRTPHRSLLLPARAGSPARTIIATTAKASAKAERGLVAAGAEVWRLPATKDGRVQLGKLAHKLGVAGVVSVLVEGGGELHASLLAGKLADELYLYVAPIIVGGAAPSWVGGDGVAKLAAAHGFTWASAPVQQGPDLRLHLTRRAW